MFKILIAEEYIKDNIFDFPSDYEIEYVFSEDDILEKTYSKSYDLYVINFRYFKAVEELRRFEDETITIFVDDYYDIYHIKKAFEIGDEYIIKPLHHEEFKIRINYFYKKLFSKKHSILRYKDLFFHTKSKQLYKKNKKIKLSPNETLLAELFLSKQEINILKYDLLEEINSTSDGALRVYISKLKKIGFDIVFERSTNSYVLKISR